MGSPVRIEGIVTEVHRDGSLGVIRGDDGSDYAYSGGHVYRGDKSLTREGQRVEFEYQVGTSWPRLATAIRVLTLIGILEVPISRLISNAIEEVIHGSELERVNEVGPCPACGEQTLKVDTGGTRCVSCAIDPRAFPLVSAPEAARVGITRLIGLLPPGAKFAAPRSDGANVAMCHFAAPTIHPCPPVALNEAMRVLAFMVQQHRPRRFVVLPLVDDGFVFVDTASGVSLRVVLSAFGFSFEIAFQVVE